MVKSAIFRVVAFLALSTATVSAQAIQTWHYETSEDKMTSAATKFATLTSDNALSLSFPYQSRDNYGELHVRQKHGGAVNVYVTIEKGQILCPGYGDGCTVLVRFDSDKPMRFSAIGPNDHSSTALFIRDTSRFLAGAKKAK
jgi:hypothetical protein